MVNAVMESQRVYVLKGNVYYLGIGKIVKIHKSLDMNEFDIKLANGEIIRCDETEIYDNKESLLEELNMAIDCTEVGLIKKYQLTDYQNLISQVNQAEVV